MKGQVSRRIHAPMRNSLGSIRRSSRVDSSGLFPGAKPSSLGQAKVVDSEGFQLVQSRRGRRRGQGKSSESISRRSPNQVANKNIMGLNGMAVIVNEEGESSVIHNDVIGRDNAVQNLLNKTTPAVKTSYKSSQHIPFAPSKSWYDYMGMGRRDYLLSALESNFFKILYKPPTNVKCFSLIPIDNKSFVFRVVLKDNGAHNFTPDDMNRFKTIKCADGCVFKELDRKEGNLNFTFSFNKEYYLMQDASRSQAFWYRY